MAVRGGDRASFAGSLQTYVEEDQKAQSEAPSFKSKPR
jgi:hypothetical protein